MNKTKIPVYPKLTLLTGVRAETQKDNVTYHTTYLQIKFPCISFLSIK